MLIMIYSFVLIILIIPNENVSFNYRKLINHYYGVCLHIKIIIIFYLNFQFKNLQNFLISIQINFLEAS